MQLYRFSNIKPDGNVGEFQQLSMDIPWLPRTGHTVTLEPASAYNGYTRFVYVVGGAVSDNNSVDSFLDDVWFVSF